ncbi:hypothetical protein [Streptomyces decoyicus]
MAHIRLVGDVISARAQLSMGMQGVAALSLEQRADIVEAILELEDDYRQAWDDVTSAVNMEQRIPHLQNLERALAAAVQGILDVARWNNIKAERFLLD